jgi:preprotein translocase subunit SecG
MSTTVIVIIVIVVFGLIVSNLLLLKDSKRMDLPQSYLDRKKAEAEHLKEQEDDNQA